MAPPRLPHKSSPILTRPFLLALTFLLLVVLIAGSSYLAVFRAFSARNQSSHKIAGTMFRTGSLQDAQVVRCCVLQPCVRITVYYVMKIGGHHLDKVDRQLSGYWGMCSLLFMHLQIQCVQQACMHDRVFSTAYCTLIKYRIHLTPCIHS
jgi:hypothetical protein